MKVNENSDLPLYIQTTPFHHRTRYELDQDIKREGYSHPTEIEHLVRYFVVQMMEAHRNEIKESYFHHSVEDYVAYYINWFLMEEDE